MDLLQQHTNQLLSLEPINNLRNHKFSLLINHAELKIADELQANDLSNSFFKDLVLLLEQLQIALH